VDPAKLEVTMSSMTILSVGSDSTALSSRASILLSMRHIVVSALSIEEAVYLFQMKSFDFLILCQSMPTIDKKRFTCLIRASGSFVPVISIVEGPRKSDPLFTATIEGTDPTELISEVENLSAKIAKRSSRARIQLGGYENFGSRTSKSR
jgi:CheY-like chemotaxis protein